MSITGCLFEFAVQKWWKVHFRSTLTITGGKADRGIDLMGFVGPCNARVFVQCKYSSVNRSIAPSHIREFDGSLCKKHGTEKDDQFIAVFAIGSAKKKSSLSVECMRAFHKMSIPCLLLMFTEDFNLVYPRDLILESAFLNPRGMDSFPQICITRTQLKHSFRQKVFIRT